MIELMRQGGPVMWPLLLSSVASVALIMERTFHLTRAARANRDFLEKVGSSLSASGIKGLEEICRASGGPAAAVLSAGLQALARGERAFAKAVEDVAERELFHLEKHLGTMAFLAEVSPLLGLLGTVTGMIRTFDVFSRQGASNPMALAGGISEALITTATGLIIAIPVMAAHHYFARRVDFMLSETEELAADVLEAAGGDAECSADVFASAASPVSA